MKLMPSISPVTSTPNTVPHQGFTLLESNMETPKEPYEDYSPSRKLTWKPQRSPMKTTVLLKGTIWVSMLLWGSVGFRVWGCPSSKWAAYSPVLKSPNKIPVHIHGNVQALGGSVKFVTARSRR